MYRSRSSTNYQMPISLKRKLHYAKRNLFSTDPPPYKPKSWGNSATTTTNSTYSNNSNYSTNSYTPTYNLTKKYGYGKYYNRHENNNRYEMNQKFDEIEAALQKAKKDRIARER
uniref:Uncharacterized protein n=1 Tax=Panagrolaimus davidi TaxID=227884 RepID=A0A914P245_9BILA